MNDKLTFHTLSGDLAVTRFHTDNDGGGGSSHGDFMLEMVLPYNPPMPIAECGAEAAEAASALIAVVSKLLPTGMQIADIQYSAATKKLLLRLPDNDHGEALQWLRQGLPGKSLPPQLMSAHDGSVVRGVIISVATPGLPEYDFNSRYFAPWVGIPEDPVTGTGAGATTPCIPKSSVPIDYSALFSLFSLSSTFAFISFLSFCLLSYAFCYELTLGLKTGSAHTVAGPYWAKALGKNQPGQVRAMIFYYGYSFMLRA